MNIEGWLKENSETLKENPDRVFDLIELYEEYNNAEIIIEFVVEKSGIYYYYYATISDDSYVISGIIKIYNVNYIKDDEI